MPAWLFFPFAPFRHSLRHFFQSLSGTAKDAVGRVGPIKSPLTRCDAGKQFHGFLNRVGGVREYL
jgi:hypothetical protein